MQKADHRIYIFATQGNVDRLPEHEGKDDDLILLFYRLLHRWARAEKNLLILADQASDLSKHLRTVVLTGRTPFTNGERLSTELAETITERKERSIAVHEIAKCMVKLGLLEVPDSSEVMMLVLDASQF